MQDAGEAPAAPGGLALQMQGINDAENILLSWVLIEGQETRVVDTCGAWLAAWRERLERCRASHLRSPVTQCVHAAPGALSDYCSRLGRQQVPCGKAAMRWLFATRADGSCSACMLRPERPPSTAAGMPADDSRRTSIPFFVMLGALHPFLCPNSC